MVTPSGISRSATVEITNSAPSHVIAWMDAPRHRNGESLADDGFAL